MEAAVFGAPHEIHLDERARPEPRPGEALIEMRAAGVCAGDLYIYLGSNPYVTYPRIGGHEIAGTVVELGTGHCRAGGRQRRSWSSRSSAAASAIPAGSANRIAAPTCRSSVSTARAASPISSSRRSITSTRSRQALSPFDASFAEPVAIGVQACRRGMVGPDDTVLVLGAGPIGLALVEVARARGADASTSPTSTRTGSQRPPTSAERRLPRARACSTR